MVTTQLVNNKRRRFTLMRDLENKQVKVEAEHFLSKQYQQHAIMLKSLDEM